MVQNNHISENSIISLSYLRRLSNRYKNALDITNVFFSLIKSARNKTKFEEIMKEEKLIDSDLFMIIQLITKLSQNPSEFNKSCLIKSVVSDEFFDRVFIFLKKLYDFNKNQTDELLLLLQFYEAVIHYLPICSTSYEKTYAILSTMYECFLKIKTACCNDLLERNEELLDVLKGKEYLIERKKFSYMDINIFPSAVDLFETPSVAPNIVIGPYKDSLQYLDINFKLLRGDFINSVKEGFELLKNENNIVIESNADFFFYKDVKSKKLILGKNARARICHVIEFSSNDVAVLSRENWDVSKKFMNGSILFFTRNNFTTFSVATVEENMWAITNGHVKFIKVSVIGNPNKIKVNLPYNMVEPRIFFEPYYQSLRMLQIVNPYNFPMGDNIISVSKEITLSGLVSEASSFDNLTRRFNYNGNDLNKSQIEALNGALSEKFTLIQGPPGTGKSHLTRKIINVLVSDSSDNRPVLVVCMRNKALDIILEPLVSAGISVLRFGRTESEILENFTLYSWKQKKWGKCNAISSKYLKTRISSFRKIINDAKNCKTPRAVDKTFELHKKACDAFRFHSDYFDGHRLLSKNIKVIGATTTGAAKRNAMLSVINPKAVIIEEAAEILEGFLISSLPLSCDHLILIGDHLQLQPITSSHLFSIKYNLNISFFERMVINGRKYHQLTVQHRMRPEIAELICPLIYKNISNHPSVFNFPDISGVAKNIFFLDHNVNESSKKSSKSIFNSHEGDFLLSLANYLVKQGYTCKEISILAAYSAQQNYLIQNCLKYPLIGSIQIQSIDNYQGAENDIILLSLVRSNGPTVGFLSKSNRINVALSRARKGLFMIGNMKTLSKYSSLWEDISHLLKKKNCIGKSFPLKCKTHSRITAVSTPMAIDNLTLGGCSRTCGYKMGCGHSCSLQCHPFSDFHEDICRKHKEKCLWN